MEPVLIAGSWRQARGRGSIRATNPDTGELLHHVFPVSERSDLDEALAAGIEASRALGQTGPESVVRFLESYADRLDIEKEKIAVAANLETGLPISPRLIEVELPRTSNQLRQAAVAAASRNWTLPTIDTATNIRSLYGSLDGAVAIFGPNNFPLAFNGIAGGDFAAAIAAGNPVIAKAHPSHPRTTQLLAELANECLSDTGLPAATLQLIYQTSYEDGEYLVSHPNLAATGFTGSRKAGLRLKTAADAAGKPIYLEMSSLNPVFILPGALRERCKSIADEVADSVLLGTGQFCTKPGLIVIQNDSNAESLLTEVARRFDDAPVAPLLSESGFDTLSNAVRALVDAGAEPVVGGSAVDNQSCRFHHTLLRAWGSTFLDDPGRMQIEAFGNVTLVVVTESRDQMSEIAAALDGNLTCSIYSATDDTDEAQYARISCQMRTRVGRLLNDKMPTGVAVVPSMNHGGPYPATGHPGFTAVGIPASIRRFAMLQCYDNVRDNRLPVELRDINTVPGLWRLIDGEWTQN